MDSSHTNWANGESSILFILNFHLITWGIFMSFNIFTALMLNLWHNVCHRVFIYYYHDSGFPLVLENLENSKPDFQSLKSYGKWRKWPNVLEENIILENISPSFAFTVITKNWFKKCFLLNCNVQCLIQLVCLITAVQNNSCLNVFLFTNSWQRKI